MSLPSSLAIQIDNEQQALEFVRMHPLGVFVEENGHTYGVAEPAKLMEFNNQRGVHDDTLHQIMVKQKEVVDHLMR